MPPADLAVTWYGHSSALIEVDGYRVLADPVWSQRCSPSRVIGPQRLHPVPAELDELPAIDAVIISHDHYDHLDIDTIKALARTQRAKFFVPLGIGAHLRAVAHAGRTGSSNWTGMRRRARRPAPGVHAGAAFLRPLPDPQCDAVVVLGGDRAAAPRVLRRRHRLHAGFAGIGDAYGPFDLTLMPIGAYHPGWPDIHMNPEEAVRAHRDVTDTGLLVPIHWATFRLAPHPWSEPVERMLRAADAEGCRWRRRNRVSW